MSATNTERLKRILEVYGADPMRWPSEERAAMEHQLGGSDPKLLPELAEAQEIDLVLSSLGSVDIPDVALQKALSVSELNPKAQIVPLNGTRNGPGRWFSRERVREALPVGIALAASLLAGVFAGLDEQIGNFATVASLETVAPGLEDTLWSFDPFNMNDGEQL